MKCCRCKQMDVPTELSVCAACAIQLRSEVAHGMLRLEEYLGQWARFHEWEAQA